jgi:hypothetical protein
LEKRDLSARLEPAQEEQDQEDDQDRAADSVVHGFLLSIVI